MKLFRHGPVGKETPGIFINNEHRDISAFGQDFNEDFFAGDGLDKLKSWTQNSLQQCPVIDPVKRFGPSVKKPSKIICIGLNYSDHAAETKATVPPEPVIFFKSTTAICGPNDHVIIPKTSKKTDWEVELAVVIAKKTSYVDEATAAKHIAGYMLHNDYSERAFQIERSGQWVKGKSCDTFAPLGPYLVTPDEIKDINNLRLWLTVNGKMMQDGNSKNLVYKIPFIISYISQFMTLLPGDIISTGTPAGVGMGQKPDPIYLKHGDIVELGIEGLGSARQELVSWESAQ
ncbi:MAG: fumarylacetoacetate hydrolase family protein [Bacteroidetes bacterium]|nr:fumarylacetoacetate hydrolase family protein [Bacteroidota bacterium]